MCQSCRSQKMLQNECLVAKFGFDRAENEPSKVHSIADCEWESKNFYFQPEAWRNNKLDEVTETTGRAI